MRSAHTHSRNRHNNTLRSVTRRAVSFPSRRYPTGVTGMTKIIPDVVDNQALYKVPPTASVCDAAKMMANNRISAVLVTEGERLVGIFTERDLTARVVAAGRDPKT